MSETRGKWALFRWLLHGSDELVMSEDWLANRARLRAYEGYTRRQLQQGAVVRTPDELQAENARIVAEREQRLAAMQPSRVLPFGVTTWKWRAQ